MFRSFFLTAGDQMLNNDYLYSVGVKGEDPKIAEFCSIIIEERREIEDNEYKAMKRIAYALMERNYLIKSKV